MRCIDMAEKDFSQIRIGPHQVGIMGLKQALEELAPEYGDKDDAEVRSMLLERVARDNYIPSVARDLYGQAFVREFRKFLGQPYQEEAPQNLDIKVLGPGCSQCDRLEQMLMELLEELQLPASLEHVRDVKEIARYRVMGVPALVINDKVMAVGGMPHRNRIKEWLAAAGKAQAAQ
jgi:hypothetical protein